MRIVIDRDAEVAMRDGVRLATDVYRLDGDERRPVLVQRLPYDKDVPSMAGASLDVLRAVRAGFVVVIQDARGRFASEGHFDPFFGEAEDGADTIAWAAEQPWSSGDVGMIGASYFGATQWLAAAQRPPALKAIAPYITSGDYRRWMWRDGAFELGFALNWALLFLALADAARRGLAGADVGAETAALIAGVDSNDELYRRLPLTDMPLLRDAAPYYRQWLEHPEPAWWQDVAPARAAELIETPALIIGGWFDLFLGGTLESYTAMRAAGATDAARRPRLVIGPWAHGNDSGVFPEIAFGLAAGREGVDLTGIQLGWFERHLGPRPDEADAGTERPVKIFVMGAGEWRDELDWPLPDAVPTAWYLHSGGSANTAGGDGTLSTRAPADEPPDRYPYDPADPVPTLGGATFLPGLPVSANAGPRDQTPLADRADVLTFASQVLERDVEVIGPIELILFASSSARDTDFTGKLIDVFPDGRAFALTDGILRARHRRPGGTPVPLEPGEVYELRIDLWATANRFRAGHRIRLDVSSSNFPRFDRNANTGRPVGGDREDDLVIANNVVFHDAEHPSRVVLPIVERAR